MKPSENAVHKALAGQMPGQRGRHFRDAKPSCLCFNPRPMIFDSNDRFNWAQQKTFDNHGGMNYAIGMIALNVLATADLFSKFENHFSKRGLHARCWHVGCGRGPRTHQWDEMEVSFFSAAWLILLASSPADARRTMRNLLRAGCRRSPLDSEVPNSSIFAYTSDIHGLN